MEIDELKPKLQFYKDKIDRYGKKLALGLGVLLVVGTFLYVIKFFTPKAISLETFLIFFGIIITSCITGTIVGVLFYKYVTRKQLKEAYIKQEETARKMRKSSKIGSAVGIGVAIICSRIIGGKAYEIIMGIAGFGLGMFIPFILINVPYNGEIILRKMGWLSEEEKRWFDEWANKVDENYKKSEEMIVESVANKRDVSNDIIRSCNKPLTRAEIFSNLKMDNTYYNYITYIKPLIDSGKLEMIIQDEKEDSQKQKFCSKHG